MLIAPALPGVNYLDAAAGLAAISSGGVLAVSGAYYLGDNLTPWVKPVDASELQRDGAYTLCRHPIYGGLVLACFGLGLLSGSVERLLVSFALYAVLSLKADEEEAMLSEKHSEYAAWAATVPKLFPEPKALIARVRGE